MNAKIISFFILIIFSSMVYAQTSVKSVSVWYYANGQEETLPNIAPGSQVTIKRDLGSSLKIRIDKVNSAGTVDYWYSTSPDGGGDIKSTTAAWWYFSNIGNSITNLIMAGVNNNTGAVRIYVENLDNQSPNLTVINTEVNNSTSSYQKEFFVGERVKVECDVWNNGGATAGSSRLGYYIGANQNDLSNRWDYDPTGSLTSNHSESEYEYYTFSNNDIGTRYFIYKADYQDVIDESSESDNVESWGPFTVLPQPLQITITAPSTDLIITQGDEVNISWEASGPNNSTVSLKYDVDQTWDNGNEKNLAYQQPLSGNYSWKTTDVEPGVYYIAGMVDDGNDYEYDYAPGKITVEAQTPSIEMNLYKISDTEGVENSNSPGNEKSVFYPGETVRITFSALNTNIDANVQCVLNIRGVDNSTTVYDSDALGENNSNDSPLQTGETDYYSFDYTIPLNSDIGYYDIGGAIRDLNDFEILYETTAAGPNSSFNGDNWILGDLFQVVPQEYSYGTTIITHGHSSDNNEYAPWQLEMAQAIANRIENAEIRLYKYENGAFELLDSKGSGAEKILIFDWANASNQHGQGYSVAASNALFTSLIQGDKDGVIDLSKPKHFIGHSRGTVINSECAKRLLYFGFSVEHITNLDPHDWGLATLFGQAGQFDDLYINDDIDIDDPPSIYSNSNSGVVSWKGIGFIDTYYQDGVTGGGPVFGIGDLGGRKVIGSYNVNLPNTLGHNDIVTWYLGTIDYTSGNNEWYNIEYNGNHIPARNGIGYNYSRFGQIEKPDNNLNDRHELNYDISEDLLTNSTFKYKSTINELWFPPNINIYPSTPGWSFFGGNSTNNTQVFMGALRLGAGDGGVNFYENNIISNRFYIPENANEFNIKYRVRALDGGDPPNVDKFRIILLGKNYSTIVLDDFWLNEYVHNYNDLRFAIPEDFKDNIVRIKLEIVKGGLIFNSGITIDEIRVIFDESINTKPFTPLALSPSDSSFVQTLTPTFEWSQYQDGGDGDNQSGYQLRVRDDENEDNIVYDTGFIESATNNSHTYSPGTFYGIDPVTGEPRYSEELVWGKYYHWHVRYMDSNGDWSDWSADDPNPHQNFFTQQELPQINVTPQNLVIKESVNLFTTNPIKNKLNLVENEELTVFKKKDFELANENKEKRFVIQSDVKNNLIFNSANNRSTTNLLENQFEVKNIGTADLTVNEIIPTQNWLSTDNESQFTLTPGESAVITVQVAWDELTESSNGILTVKSTDLNNPEVKVNVTVNPLQLSVPVANSATEITTISFRANWTQVDWATGYRLDISKNESFTEFLPEWEDKNVGNSYTTQIDNLSPNTTYYYRVRGVKDNFTSENSNTIEVQTLQQTETHFQTVWSGNPYLAMNIYLTEVKINEEFANIGDEVAVFDGNNCVGVVKITENGTFNSPLSIIVSTDDPTTDVTDGFTPSNEIKYRFWSEYQQAEYIFFDAQYSSGNNLFSSSGTSVLSLNFINNLVQTIEFSSGWNIFSLSVYPENIDLLEVLHQVIDSDNLIKIQDESGSAIDYISGFGWINNIGNWESTEGYYIKVKNDQIVEFLGTPIGELSIELFSGWNYMSYPIKIEQDALTVLESLITNENLIKVQDERGLSIDYLEGFGWINNIGQFRESEGYYIKVSSNGTIMVQEPTNKISKSSTSNELVVPSITITYQREVNPYNPMNIYLLGLDSAIYKDSKLSILNENKIMVGEIELKYYSEYNSKFIPIILGQDDPTTNIIDGFKLDEKISFELNTSDESKKLFVSNQNNSNVNELVFQPRATEVIRLTEMHTESDVKPIKYSLDQNYPNPFNPSTIIRFEIPEKSNVKISVYNMLGERIKELVNSEFESGFHEINFTAGDISSGIYLYQMVTNKKIITKKMLLIK